MDKERHIYTLPVVIGEKIARFTLVGLLILQYLIVLYLVLIGFFTPIMLIVVFALRTFIKILPMFKAPRPAEKPADFPDVWPNYFVAVAFVHNREFGIMFLLGLILNWLWKMFL
jgi:1,4-dihydroxy-2-naphthoate octaprenyltransferase